MHATEPAPRIDPADYLLPDGLTDEQLEARLADPLVRICNLYWIEDPDGREVRFCPNGPQCEVLHAVYVEKEQRIAIPKARAIGFSTLIALIAFDRAHFSAPGQNIRAAIIDRTAPDAQAKLEKIKFAWDRLPEELKDAATIANKSQIEWANGSTVLAGLKVRGKTPHVLHISEWGPIAYEDPKRSAEIVTGALQSASGEDALVFAESTHMGGKGGDWYDLIKRSLETPAEYRTVKDFRVMFFPWWQEARYTLEGDARQIDLETRVYFDGDGKHIRGKVAETGHRFTDGQRLFYFKKKAELGRNIYAEFPTVIEECWMTPIVGAIYGPDVDKARAAGRVSNNVAMHYEGFPVYSTFDIGAAVNTNCWLWQVIGDRVNYLECLRGDDECNTPGAWAKRLKARPYAYGGHFLPHDGETLWARLLREAELKGVVCLPRPVDEWDNINDALSSFSRCFFNAKGCEWGLDSLEAFRAKEEADGVTIRNIPVHDWASHASTAFGYTHQAIRLGLCVDRSAMPTKPRHPGQRPQAIIGLSASRQDRRPVRVLR
jgi:hypothetical protein